MDQPLLPLRPTLAEQFAQVLQDWCEVAGAKGAKLVLYPQGNICPYGPQVQPPDSPYTECVVNGSCRLQVAHEGTVVCSAGDPPVKVFLCLTCRLASGSTIALQTDHLDAPLATLLRHTERARLGAPLLMWAKEALEREALQARLVDNEERARTALNTAIKAQEDERERLAFEVHDRVAQTLATVFQQLQTVESLARTIPEIHQAAVRGSALCREAIHEARDIMNDLRPPVLDELGLMALLEEEARRLETDVGCYVQTKLTCEERPPRDVEVVLYRIFHEALINIGRYANATKVVISANCDHDAVLLQVEDNGAGFDVREARRRKAVGGLISMQRRTELVGGSFQLRSKPGKGTRVTVRIPIPGSNNHRGNVNER